MKLYSVGLTITLATAFQSSCSAQRAHSSVQSDASRSQDDYNEMIHILQDAKFKDCKMRLESSLTLSNDKEIGYIALYGARDYTRMVHIRNDDLTQSYTYCLKQPTGHDSTCLYVSTYTNNGQQKINSATIERFIEPIGKIECASQN